MNNQNWLGPPTSAFIQHKASRWFLETQVRWKFGPAVASQLEFTDLKTFSQWFFAKRKIKLGERALRGVTLVATVEDGKPTTCRRPKVIYLYHRLQTTER